ncbi:MAG: hypothetical protein QXO86_05820 [Nitrososphaerota archaeon]
MRYPTCPSPLKVRGTLQSGKLVVTLAGDSIIACRGKDITELKEGQLLFMFVTACFGIAPLRPAIKSQLLEPQDARKLFELGLLEKLIDQTTGAIYARSTSFNDRLFGFLGAGYQEISYPTARIAIAGLILLLHGKIKNFITPRQLPTIISNLLRFAPKEGDPRTIKNLKPGHRIPIPNHTVLIKLAHEKGYRVVYTPSAGEKWGLRQACRLTRALMAMRFSPGILITASTLEELKPNLQEIQRTTRKLNPITVILSRAGKGHPQG